jgi:hypothetical protein
MVNMSTLNLISMLNMFARKQGLGGVPFSDCQEGVDYSKFIVYDDRDGVAYDGEQVKSHPIVDSYIVDSGRKEVLSNYSDNNPGYIFNYDIDKVTGKHRIVIELIEECGIIMIEDGQWYVA